MSSFTRYGMALLYALCLMSQLGCANELATNKFSSASITKENILSQERLKIVEVIEKYINKTKKCPISINELIVSFGDNQMTSGELGRGHPMKLSSYKVEYDSTKSNESFYNIIDLAGKKYWCAVDSTALSKGK